MIISASRRTDIPAAYADWFFHRLREGHVLVRNPMNPHRVSCIGLTPPEVDGIVFWTKNPAPMLPQLGALTSYAYYFQVSMTAYGPELEPGLPDKATEVIPAVLRLSDAIGPERVIWRYDPILLSPAYSEEAHAEAFYRLAARLKNATRRCTISFIDNYRSTARNAAALALSPLPEEAMRRLASTLAGIARDFGIAMDACAEAVDLSGTGVTRARCVDASLLGMIRGMPLRARRDRGQRPDCLCHESVDIGVYNTCLNGCKYCYANYDDKKIPRNIAAHDPKASLLTGALQPGDTVYNRRSEAAQAKKPSSHV